MHGVKRTRLTEELKLQKLARDKVKIENYRGLQDLVLTQKENQVYDEKAFQQTTLLLDLNPEFYTIWNYRRDVMMQLSPDDTAIYELELKFILKQMLKYPKCYWIWNHRRWCLQKINQRPIYLKELEIVNQMLSRDERNFHGWAYRRFVIAELESFISSSDELIKVQIEEFEYTTKMINKNISNYSAWHNRSKLILKIFTLQSDSDIKLFKDKLDFFDKEVNYLINAMFIDSEDSSIWIYIRWLVKSPFFEDVEKTESQTKLLNTIIELNELEKSDNGSDNEWCLKIIQVIQRAL